MSKKLAGTQVEIATMYVQFVDDIYAERVADWVKQDGADSAMARLELMSAYLRLDAVVALLELLQFDGAAIEVLETASDRYVTLMDGAPPELQEDARRVHEAVIARVRTRRAA